jgi:uncharacterized protein
MLRWQIQLHRNWWRYRVILWKSSFAPITGVLGFARLILLVLTAAILCLLTSYTIKADERTLFSPHKTRPREVTGVSHVTKEDVQIPNDSLTNTAYALLYEDSKDFVIYFPGIGESAYDDLKRAMILCQSNRLNVVACDYRGYGSSVGEPTLEALLADSQAIYNHVCAKYRPTSIFVYGHSLGTTAALNLGARTTNRLNGIILEAVFTNAKDAFSSIGGGLPWPWSKLIKLQVSQKLTDWKPQPEDLAASVKCPLLIIHGTKDRIFPVSMAETLCRKAASQEKELLVIDGAGHSIELSKPPAAREIRDFIERHKR